MKKFLILILTILLMPVIAGLYGALHDQLSYTISPEYFTKFKFYQFELAYEGNEAILPHPRMAAAQVGYLATWWTGIPIGLVIGFFGLLYKSDKMLRAILTATIITLVVAMLTGLTGLIIGWYHLRPEGIHWRLPENLQDVHAYIAVGSMHNFSYLGGLLGLIAAVVFMSIRKPRRNATIL